ncbi:MAG: peptide-methionine (S)-S-oxide reductase MsrA, partial [Chitinophagales bacterium]
MKFIQGLLLAAMLMISLSSCAEKSKTIAQAEETMPAQNSISPEALAQYHQATFAAGCFWCVEGVFESVKGVQEAISGYAGGPGKNPTYEEVGGGSTGHAESVTVYYDSTIIDYPTLLKVFFASQDPTQVNGQGPDHGTQYRTVVFYRNDQEKKLTNDYISQLNASGKYSAAIAAQVVPFTVFYEAEGYHQDYIQHNP